MEDLIKFLPFLAIIGIAIWKEVNKAKAKNETAQQGTPSIPELAGDTVPLPEAWGKIPNPGEIFKPIEPMKKPQSFQSQKMKEKTPKKDNKQSFIANHYISTDDESIHLNTPQESPSQENTEGEFSINSAEDARRAIIWGEILQRKY